MNRVFGISTANKQHVSAGAVTRGGQGCISLVVAIGMTLTCPFLSAQQLNPMEYRWKSVAIVAGGFITGLNCHPAERGLLYARTDIGGAYRWNSKRQKWIPLTDFVGASDRNLLGIESIGLDPNDPARLYLAAGTYTKDWAGKGAIFRSVDRGQTFQRTDLPIQLGANEEGRYAGERLQVDPTSGNQLYFGSRNDGLWRSSDYGATWSQVKSFPVTGPTNGVGITFVAFDIVTQAGMSASPVVYVGVSSRESSVYRSFDGGQKWEAVPNQPTGLLPNHGVSGSDGMLYLTYGDQPGPNGMNYGLVWKFDFRRNLWTNITPQTPGNNNSYHFGYGGIALDLQRPGTLMVATMDRWYPGDEVYRSTDGGARWMPISTSAIRDESLSPFLRFGNDAASFGWWIGAMAIDPFDSNRSFYGTGATIWTSSDLLNSDARQSTHWTVGARGIEEAAVLQLSSPPSGAHLLSGVSDLGGFVHHSLRQSPSGGMMRNPIFTDTTGLDFAERNPALVVRVGTSAVASHGARSTDGGDTWTPFATEPSGTYAGAGSIAIAADGGTIVWSPNDGPTSYSRDSGLTWTAASQVPSRISVIADRQNAKTFYAFDANAGKLFVSGDGGLTFAYASTIPSGSGQLRAASGIEGDLWLASTYAGLYHSTDSGITFTRLQNVQEAYAVGFGKPPSGSTFPTIFLSGKVANSQAIFASIDGGTSWQRINGDPHQYGWVGLITGDPRVYGRVYLGTNGRGIIEGNTRPAKKL